MNLFTERKEVVTVCVWGVRGVRGNAGQVK